MEKNAAKSTTIWFGLALIALDFLPQVQDLLVQLYPQAMEDYGLAAIGIVILLLRVKTGQPISLPFRKKGK